MLYNVHAAGKVASPWKIARHALCGHSVIPREASKRGMPGTGRALMTELSSMVCLIFSIKFVNASSVE